MNETISLLVNERTPHYA